MNELKNAIKEAKYSTFLTNDSMTFISEALKNDDVIFFEILYSDEILSNFDKAFYLSRLFEEHATKSLNMKVLSDLKTLRKSVGIKSKEYWELSLRVHWLFLKE
ncbi:hypothetical protein O9G_005929 [Rozella allomycis CSF55]|uniref:Uncharacterized protein n=1 Tax=Rozella allomycis (strain CSF55) TaxID=988480 RepID=A0A075B0H2_ROZAC|nr:hypothetical protein O9G_005929 [Rozella allomycis CSF55]|eukprot:EPZ36074.1 hypothetical protein O9G_005929 [Rozella allomycis CSF55]